jgi:hypothetical protein
MAISRMRIVCWLPKSTNTHSEYITLIDFLLQQRLHEHASMLRHEYILMYITSRLNWLITPNDYVHYYIPEIFIYVLRTVK